jgi:hypothetical protein
MARAYRPRPHTGPSKPTKHPKRLELRKKISELLIVLRTMLELMGMPRKDFFRWNGWELEVATNEGYKSCEEARKMYFSDEEEKYYRKSLYTLESPKHDHPGWNRSEMYLWETLIERNGGLTISAFGATRSALKVLRENLHMLKEYHGDVRAKHTNAKSCFRQAEPYIDKCMSSILLRHFWEPLQTIYHYPRNTQGLQMLAVLQHIQKTQEISGAVKLSRWAEENKNYWPMGLVSYAYHWSHGVRVNAYLRNHSWEQVSGYLKKAYETLLEDGLAKSSWRWLLRQKPSVQVILMGEMLDPHEADIEGHRGNIAIVNRLATACVNDKLALKAVRLFWHLGRVTATENNVFIRNAMVYLSKPGKDRHTPVTHALDWIHNRRARVDANILSLPIRELSNRATAFFQQENLRGAQERMAEEAAALGRGVDEPMHKGPYVCFKYKNEVTVREIFTVKGLQEEGSTMHHCVASYARSVIRGDSRIFSITRKDGKKELRGTLELRCETFRGEDPIHVNQFRSFCNAEIDDSLLNAAKNEVVKYIRGVYKETKKFVELLEPMAKVMDDQVIPPL